LRSSYLVLLRRAKSSRDPEIGRSFKYDAPHTPSQVAAAGAVEFRRRAPQVARCP